MERHFLLVGFFQMFFAADHRFFLHSFIHKNHDQERAADERKYKSMPESIVKSKIQGLQSLYLAEECVGLPDCGIVGKQGGVPLNVRINKSPDMIIILHDADPFKMDRLALLQHVCCHSRAEGSAHKPKIMHQAHPLGGLSSQTSQGHGGKRRKKTAHSDAQRYGDDGSLNGRGVVVQRGYEIPTGKKKNYATYRQDRLRTEPVAQYASPRRKYGNKHGKSQHVKSGGKCPELL